MLTKTSSLKGFAIQAQDGELGIVDDFYFDDQTWAIRYLTVETGSWLDNRQVLISPISVIHADWQAKRIEVGLTKQQVEQSPAIDTHKPVSRQHELAYIGYYGYGQYWGGPYLWGPAGYPSELAIPASILATSGSSDPAADRERQKADSHLRSSAAVSGYSVQASDGDIGHVDGFLVDDRAWAIRYVEIATRNWWPGKKVLVSPLWINHINWDTSTVSMALTRETIKSSPEYLESMPISREYENKLYLHYGRAAYWEHEPDQKASSTMSGI